MFYNHYLIHSQQPSNVGKYLQFIDVRTLVRLKNWAMVSQLINLEKSEL